MLVKQELLTIPLDTEAPCEREVAVDVCVVELPRSGQVLAAEMRSPRHVQRFFSDGQNYILYDVAEAEWTRARREDLFGSYGYQYADEISTNKQRAVAADFFNDVSERGRKVVNSLNRFIDRKYIQKRNRDYEAKQARIDRHLAMFPPPPADAGKWAADKLFPAFGIMEKMERGAKQRRCTCTACGRKWKVPKETAHRSQGECPKCHKSLTFWKRQYAASIKDKTMVTFAYKVDDTRMFRWDIAEMRIHTDTLRPIVTFEANEWDIYPSGDRRREYCYAMRSVAYYGRQLVESRWRPSTAAYIYPYNLHDVFGERVEGVDLQAVFEYPQRVSLPQLVEKLHAGPRCEYLLKMGLAELANALDARDFQKGKGLEAIGVSNQYLPMYREMRPPINVHRLLRGIPRFLPEEKVKRFCELGATKDYYTVDNVLSELKTMSVERFLNYYEKQKRHYPKEPLYHIIQWRKDYVQMLRFLGIESPTKSDLFPSWLKTEHDRVAARVKAVETERERKEFAETVELLEKTVPMVQKGKHMTCLPTCNKDFVREGQTLHHCVGNGGYFREHKKGRRIIVFIRKTEEPDKPFVTMQVDLMEERIIQIYGDHDKKPPTDVLRFADEFIRQLKKAHRKAAKNAAVAMAAAG